MSTLKVDTIKSDTTPTVTISDGLSVSGVTTSTGNVYISDKIIHTGDTDTAIRFPGSDIFAIETGGTERLRVDSAGLKITDKLIHFGDTDTFLEFGTDTITLDTAGSERFRIASDGKVGIGIASPTELLEVNSTGASTAIEISAGEASTTTGESKLVLRSLHSASGTGYSRSEIASLGVAGGDSDLIFRTTTDNNGPQEKMRITYDGNVGIGTDNPQVRLTVSSDSPAVMDVHHVDGGTNDEARIILGALAANPPSNRGAGIAALNNGAGHDLLIKCSASHSAGPTEKLRITSAGAIGIAGANYGSSGQVLTSGGSGAAVSWAAASGGPTHYSKFTLESVQGNNDPINNWDLYSPGLSPTINTAVTNTNGVFSFPSTGIWECQASILFYLNGGTTEFRLETWGTTNDGTNWDIIGRQYGWFHNNSSTNYMSVSTMPFLLDITDTSNCKVKFVIAGGPASLYTGGDDNDLYSGCHFIRWADT